MNKIRAYTDGACSGNPGPGGWSVCILLDECTKVISGGNKNTTNNRMELLAVVQAIKDILLNYKCDEIEIISDSAYVVNAINNSWLLKWKMNGWKTSDKKDVKNTDLWKQLLCLKKECIDKNINLSLSKVKGHDGNFFNELVDNAAREEVKKIKNQGVN